ncbi:hypothetical protein [Palaeococcus sp. (in: euryarchaeotes)]
MFYEERRFAGWLSIKMSLLPQIIPSGSETYLRKVFLNPLQVHVVVIMILDLAKRRKTVRKFKKERPQSRSS